MIRHQNAVAMLLAGALTRGINPPLNVHHFEHFQGGELLVLSRNMATALQKLRQNHRQNQEVLISGLGTRLSLDFILGDASD